MLNIERSYTDPPRKRCSLGARKANDDRLQLAGLVGSAKAPLFLKQPTSQDG